MADQASDQGGGKSLLPLLKVVYAYSLGFPPGTPLPHGAGLGTLESTVAGVWLLRMWSDQKLGGKYFFKGNLWFPCSYKMIYPKKKEPFRC
jgi:hypothetical protein